MEEMLRESSGQIKCSAKKMQIGAKLTETHGPDKE